MATLVTAFAFTLGVAYFASLRKSKVILILGILGAYLTPFILGQNDTWSQNISFNSFLIYFAAVNVVIFMLGREIAIYDLIPLNLVGLFFGTYTLHALSYAGMTQVGTGFFEGDIFTVILLTLLVIMSIAGIALSSRYFTGVKESTMLAFGYLAPLAWFIVHMEALSVSSGVRIVGFAVLALAYFVAWYILRPLAENRYQHVAVYSGGLIATIFAIIALFPDFNMYSSLLIAYIGLVFSVIYLIDGNKGERLLASLILSFIGGVLALMHIYGFERGIITYPTLFALTALIPAILIAPLVRIQGKTHASVVELVNVYSATALTLAAFILIIRFIQSFDFSFAFLVFPGFLIVLWTYFSGPSSQNRGTMMRVGTGLVSIGFFYSFFSFVGALAPHVADNDYFFKNGAIFGNWDFIKAIFAVVTYFLALAISRDIQRIEKTDRPSFLLVIIAYTTLLLIVNYAIITICNDLGVVMSTGGPRAIGTTIWWIILSISMLMAGIQYGRGYRSEKLLGLMLLLLTIIKIGLYDLAMMDMDKKIIVLMVVGGLIMLFSYFLQVK